MSKQRYINTKMWEDSWFVQLDPIEKLFFIYLLTNPMTNIIGAYELSKGTIGRATGLESRVVDEILSRFEKASKVFYVNGWVVLPNFVKHQNYKSPKIQKGIEIELQDIPTDVKRLIKIPYAYGIDTVSHLIKLNTNGIEPVLEEPENTFKTNFKQPSKKKGKHVIAQAKDICQMFSEAKGGNYENTIHIEALVGLLQQHGVDKVTEYAEKGIALKKKPFQIQINKPVDLADHWAQLDELINNPQPVDNKQGWT